MGTMLDALKKSGHVTQEQADEENARKRRVLTIQKENQRKREERQTKSRKARRLREEMEDIPDFIKEAIAERERKVQGIINRAEKTVLGPLKPEVVKRLKSYAPLDVANGLEHLLCPRQLR